MRILVNGRVLLKRLALTLKTRLGLLLARSIAFFTVALQAPASRVKQAHSASG